MSSMASEKKPTPWTSATVRREAVTKIEAVLAIVDATVSPSDRHAIRWLLAEVGLVLGGEIPPVEGMVRNASGDGWKFPGDDGDKTADACAETTRLVRETMAALTSPEECGKAPRDARMCPGSGQPIVTRGHFSVPRCARCPRVVEPVDGRAPEHDAPKWSTPPRP